MCGALLYGRLLCGTCLGIRLHRLALGLTLRILSDTLCRAVHILKLIRKNVALRLHSVIVAVVAAVASFAAEAVLFLRAVILRS